MDPGVRNPDTIDLRGICLNRREFGEIFAVPSAAKKGRLKERPFSLADVSTNRGKGMKSAEAKSCGSLAWREQNFKGKAWLMPIYPLQAGLVRN
jgi:hypothetical protein